jgi:hypothetical protein
VRVEGPHALSSPARQKRTQRPVLLSQSGASGPQLAVQAWQVVTEAVQARVSRALSTERTSVQAWPEGQSVSWAQPSRHTPTPVLAVAAHSPLAHRRVVVQETPAAAPPSMGASQKPMGKLGSALNWTWVSSKGKQENPPAQSAGRVQLRGAGSGRQRLAEFPRVPTSPPMQAKPRPQEDAPPSATQVALQNPRVVPLRRQLLPKVHSASVAQANTARWQSAPPSRGTQLSSMGHTTLAQAPLPVVPLAPVVELPEPPEVPDPLVPPGPVTQCLVASQR